MLASLLVSLKRRRRFRSQTEHYRHAVASGPVGLAERPRVSQVIDRDGRGSPTRTFAMSARRGNSRGNRLDFDRRRDPNFRSWNGRAPAAKTAAGTAPGGKKSSEMIRSIISLVTLLLALVLGTVVGSAHVFSSTQQCELQTLVAHCLRLDR
jgi:hypothetical protein